MLLRTIESLIIESIKPSKETVPSSKNEYLKLPFSNFSVPTDSSTDSAATISFSVSAALTENGATVTIPANITELKAADSILVIFFIGTPPKIKMRSRSCAEKRTTPINCDVNHLPKHKYALAEHAFLPKDKNTYLRMVIVFSLRRTYILP